MNIYFLVEGKTERKVYPRWISYFSPELERVNSPSDANKNNYYLISGGGFPSILDNHLRDSVDDVNFVGNYDYLVLALDTDDFTAVQKIDEVDSFIRINEISLLDCELIIIPQVVCMETWFLGNRKIYARNPSNDEGMMYSHYYDVSRDDPELMKTSNSFTGSIGDFHYRYLKSMLREKHIRYSKTKPAEVGKEHYIIELTKRLENDSYSLKSMRELFGFIKQVSGHINA